ncbi:MAG: fused response regulator/phosphatase [Pseudomonadota bacterium]
MENNRFTVLVIDDEELNRFLVREILTEAGYAVFAAENGWAGREIARQELPDLILLDVMMPEESGYQTCRLLKEDRLTVEIPVIFISALDEPRNRLDGLELGAIDYISKPFLKDELLARVKNYLKLHHAHRLLRREWSNRLQQVQEAHHAILVDPAEVPGARFAVRYRTVLEAGGDFYDAFSLGDNKHGYFIADISGHDLGAFFTISALKALIRQNSSLIYAPDETIRTINRVLATIFKAGQHLTAVYLTVDRRGNTAEIVNAGHLPVLHLSGQGASRWLEPDSDIMGAFADGHYRRHAFPVGPGDRFILCTDGLLESFLDKGVNREAGLARLRDAAHHTRGLPAEEAVASIAAILRPEREEAAEDDFLLLLVDV